MPLRAPSPDELAALRRRVRGEEARAFAAVEEQVTYVVELLKKWKPGRKLSNWEWALLVHLGRATYIVVHGIVPVCESMAGDLAMMLIRSLYETMLSAYWMSLDPDARANAFDRYAALETRELHLLLVELGVIEAHEVPVVTPEREKALHDEFPKPYLGWTKRRLEALEKDVVPLWPDEGARREFWLYAKAVRKLGNRHTHVSPGETIARMTVNEGTAEVTIGPTQRGRDSVPLTLKFAAWCYGELVDLAVENLKLGDRVQWQAHYRRAIFRTKTLILEQTTNVSQADPCPCGSGLEFGRCHAEPPPGSCP